MAVARISKKLSFGSSTLFTADVALPMVVRTEYWHKILIGILKKSTDKYQFYLTVRETLQELRSKSCYNSNINFDKCLSEEVLILSIVKTTLCSSKSRHLNNILPMGNFNMQNTYIKSCLSSLTISKYYYRTRAIISRSRFEAALVYKPRILSLKNEEFTFLVHKLSAI